MATKLTDLAALANNPASGDLHTVVDVSDTSGGAAGTSKKVQNKYIIQTDKISLNNSQVTDLDDGGTSGEFQVLVAAPGSGFMVVPLTVTIIATGAGATQSNRKALYIGYDVDQTDDFWVEYAYFMDGLASGNVRTLTGEAGSGSTRSSADSSIDNLALSVWANDNFDGGWAMDIYITYQIVKI
tara:strand:+ start:170 stop:721 length:552 start_codon:yes stop_codon:yes gene_type:complete